MCEREREIKTQKDRHKEREREREIKKERNKETTKMKIIRITKKKIANATTSAREKLPQTQYLMQASSPHSWFTPTVSMHTYDPP